MTTEPSLALEGFLRGVQRRARLFAHWQAGDAQAVVPALAFAERQWRQAAVVQPLAQWPVLYWRALLQAPALRMPLHGLQPEMPPGIARLPHGPRAVVLLSLVAGLDDETAAQVLQTPPTSLALARQQLLPVNALGRPDADVWQAWQAAALRALAEPEPALHRHGAHAQSHAPGAVAWDEDDADQDAPSARPRWLLPLLWVGVGACALALAATFWWTPPPALAARLHGLTLRQQTLAAAATPKARMDATDALCLHPELPRLQHPQADAAATALAFHAWWWAGQSAPLEAVSPSPASLTDAALLDPPPAQSLTHCRAALQAMQPVARQALEQAVARFDALPPVARRASRERWQAWWALPREERAWLLQAARAFAALPADQRATALAAYRALPPTQQYGWRLGPALGADYPALHDLVAYLPPDQREAMLRLLRDMEPDQRAVLARVVFSTPVELRPQLREDLLAQPAWQREVWLRQKLTQ